MLVKLINWTPEPAKTIASRFLNYSGKMVASLEEISLDVAEETVIDVMNTTLQGALESVMLNFNVFDVPRWLTHQIVRVRHASYSQTTLRFTIIDDETDWYYKPYAEQSVQSYEHSIAMANAAQHYYHFINELKTPVQDARGVLPLDTLTFIGIDMGYRTLVQLAGDRLCKQAQPVWSNIMGQMKEEVRNKLGSLFADYLVPICVHMECCPFGSTLDRGCPMRTRYPLRKTNYWMEYFGT